MLFSLLNKYPLVPTVIICDDLAKISFWLGCMNCMSVYSRQCAWVCTPLPTFLSSSWPSFLSKGTPGLGFNVVPWPKISYHSPGYFMGLIGADGPTNSLGFDTCDSEREMWLWQAELLTAEKCAGLNVFRVMVLALRVFRDAVTSLLNLHCEHKCKSRCGWYILYTKAELGSGFLLSVRLDVEGACGVG